jgi:hypothetical protein
MTRKPLFVFALVAVAASATVGSMVAHSGLRGVIGERAYPTKAEFDRVFADVETAALVDPDRATTERAQLGAAGWKLMNAAPSQE